MKVKIQYNTEKRGMRRSASVPRNLRSDAHAARAARAAGAASAARAASDALLGKALMSGSVLIRALPQSTKVMRVQFVATERELRILFEQATDGLVQAFELCRLDYRTLAAGCVQNDPAMFVIAATDHDKLFYEIYCVSPDISRNVWLGFFRFKHVLMTSIFVQNQSRRSSDCSGASYDADAVRYAIQTVREATDSEHSI
jgi:hypothetical protein